MEIRTFGVFLLDSRQFGLRKQLGRASNSHVKTWHYHSVSCRWFGSPKQCWHIRGRRWKRAIRDRKSPFMIAPRGLETCSIISGRSSLFLLQIINRIEHHIIESIESDSRQGQFGTFLRTCSQLIVADFRPCSNIRSPTNVDSRVLFFQITTTTTNSYYH